MGEEQKAKLDRVSKQLVKYSRDIRSTKGRKTQLPEEEDISIREMSDFNKNIATQLVQNIQSYPEAFSTLSNFLYQANIPIPSASQMGTPTGSRSSSRASSVTSLISTRSSTVKSAKSVTLDADFSPPASPAADFPPRT